MDKELSESITPEFLGIIWVTKDQLLNKPKYFEQIDYLFNGLLTYSDQSAPQKKSLYMGNSYGRPFFLAHFEENNPDFEKDIDETFKMVQGLDSGSKKILVISDRKINAKRFKNFSLQTF